jgi:hypothetical protein
MQATDQQKSGSGNSATLGGSRTSSLATILEESTIKERSSLDADVKNSIKFSRKESLDVSPLTKALYSPKSNDQNGKEVFLLFLIYHIYRY